MKFNYFFFSVLSIVLLSSTPGHARFGANGGGVQSQLSREFAQARAKVAQLEKQLSHYKGRMWKPGSEDAIKVGELNREYVYATRDLQAIQREMHEEQEGMKEKEGHSRR